MNAGPTRRAFVRVDGASTIASSLVFVPLINFSSAVNYRSVDDLNRCLLDSLHRVPRDVDLVAGIPRSGLLPANLLALYLNRPLTDLAGLVEGRLIRSGDYRAPASQLIDPRDARRILLVDDSVSTGRQLERALESLRDAGLASRLTTLAVYVTSRALSRVDITCEVCELPRFFEWNLMQHDRMPEFAVDLDGVLCCDPTDAENDDGPAYAAFLRRAEPRFIPSRPIGAIVTCRLEKYRAPTEAWLGEHGVIYGELVMMDLPDQQTREALGSHAAFKAAAYSGSDACLFIESSWEQAQAIARISGKPVISLEHPGVAHPSSASRWRSMLQRTRERPREMLLKPYVRLQRRLQRLV